MLLRDCLITPVLSRVKSSDPSATTAREYVVLSVQYRVNIPVPVNTDGLEVILPPSLDEQDTWMFLAMSEPPCNRAS